MIKLLIISSIFFWKISLHMNGEAVTTSQYIIHYNYGDSLITLPNYLKFKKF